MIRLDTFANFFFLSAVFFTTARHSAKMYPVVHLAHLCGISWRVRSRGRRKLVPGSFLGWFLDKKPSPLNKENTNVITNFTLEGENK